MQAIGRFFTPTTCVFAGTALTTTAIIGGFAYQDLYGKSLQLPGCKHPILTHAVAMIPALIPYGILSSYAVPRSLSLAVLGSYAAIGTGALLADQCLGNALAETAMKSLVLLGFTLPLFGAAFLGAQACRSWGKAATWAGRVAGFFTPVGLVAATAIVTTLAKPASN